MFWTFLPPPNVTGKLHIGHALNATIQDVYVRFNKAYHIPEGVNWVWGTDHASIATESKVRKTLAENGVTDITDEELYNHIKSFADQNRDNIKTQLRMLNCDIDNNDGIYTMSDEYCDLVKTTFISLYKRNLIYEDLQEINYDTVLKTAISDEECEEVNGKIISTRSGGVVEKRTSKEWFFKLSQFKDVLINALDDINITSERTKNTYLHFVNNLKDWCISRQLLWGHKIPIWYYNNQSYCADNIQEAARLAETDTDNMIPETRTLDTWFSSWLYHIVAFTKTNEFNTNCKYIPADILVTGADIIFFWVAKMIVASRLFDYPKPFKTVYITGIVRDKQGRKMSKSLNNSPDLDKLIDKHGSDVIRATLLRLSTKDNDIIFDESYLQEGYKIIKKLASVDNYIKLLKPTDKDDNPIVTACQTWFTNKIHESYDNIKKYLDDYDVYGAFKEALKLLFDYMSNWYIPTIQKTGVNEHEYKVVQGNFVDMTYVLESFIPSITQLLRSRIHRIERIKNSTESDDNDIVDYAREIHRKLNVFRSMYKINASETLKIGNRGMSEPPQLLIDYIKLIANADLEFTAKDSKYSFNTRIGTVRIYKDVEVDTDDILKELASAKSLLKRVEDKLNNPRFIENATKEQIAYEEQKQKDAKERIDICGRRLNCTDE